VEKGAEKPKPVQALPELRQLWGGAGVVVKTGEYF